nr:hypothetical protein [Novosphingobium aerophilum]
MSGWTFECCNLRRSDLHRADFEGTNWAILPGSICLISRTVNCPTQCSCPETSRMHRSRGQALRQPSSCSAH